MAKILVNFANDRFEPARKHNSKTGLTKGGFDRVVECRIEDVEESYRAKYSDTVSYTHLDVYKRQVNLEAEACGTPVVTYDTGGCRETVRLLGSRVISSFSEAVDAIAEMKGRGLPC